MKKLQLLMLIFTLLCPGLQAQSTVKSRHLKPSNFQKKVITIVSGKSRNYYSLNASAASVISVKGPGNLRVLTRGRLVPGKTGKIAYEIVYTLDGGQQKSFKTSDAVRSTKATYTIDSLGVPGSLKEFEIVLGHGDHTIEFKLKDNLVPVAAQYIFVPAKEKKQEWTAFSPVLPSEPVDLVTKETSVSYYRFSQEKPVRVEINGPTELRVLTRVEFQYQMQGRVNYRVQVKETGKVLNTYQLSSTRSDVTEYKDNKDLIPGKACEFAIDVPSGKHVYEIIPLDKDKNSLLSRFLLPKKDVKLTN
jgi:hypothetical protein